MNTIARPTLLQVRDLCFGFGARTLLQDWSADFPAGLTVVLGEESRGKTTLLHLMAGTLQAAAGELILAGTSLRDAPPDYRAQVFWIEPRTTALDTVVVQSFLANQQAAWPQWNADLLDALLEGLDLVQHLDKQLHMLSAGSRRKVFLAAAFASGAPLTLLDTPFAALDRRSAGLLTELLEDAALQDTRAFVLADYEAPSVEAAYRTLLLATP